MLATIAIITLVPFAFRVPEHWRLTGFVTLSDLVQNVALFVPLGFAVAFAGGRAIVVGAAASLTVEMLQLFVPGRYASPLDLATNTLGAWLGAALYRSLAGAVGRRHQGAGVRALDLPLMGSVYLIVPLVWLVGLSHGSEIGRLWLVSFPLLGGAIVLGSMSRHYLEPRGMSRAVGAFAATGWAALALLPGWHQSWRAVAALSLAAGAVTALLAWLVAHREAVGRRFEIVTVRRAVIPLVVFLAVAGAWPVDALEPGWSWSLGWSRTTHALARESILQVLELCAGSAVIGYLIAESRSRAVEPAERTRWVLGLMALTMALALELLRSVHPHRGGSVAEAGLLFAATGFGGLLYARQRAYVLALLGRVPAAPAAAPAQAAGYRIGPPVPVDGAPK